MKVIRNNLRLLVCQRMNCSAVHRKLCKVRRGGNWAFKLVCELNPSHKEDWVCAGGMYIFRENYAKNVY